MVVNRFQLGEFGKGYGNRTLMIHTYLSLQVIAHDVDVQRSNLLIHQTKRMCTSNLAVTTHEAQHFPSCRWKKNNTTNGSDLGGMSMTELLFDRVLCDVPCSGDGTLRKAPGYLIALYFFVKCMSVGMANGVHCLQLQIAMRGMFR
ncbi:unnamed protein product [Lactuca saligna]|uniref:SAM-dependent MTase RsmB/NOP-type domain-containing protein n=1 Tax=Lactuca saligna TaxID=75948 RepID=A0AA36EMZ7_LACSI|nr:unnamed protein product [Lactuca saligna]